MNVPLRVIFVEDDYLLAETLAECLVALGYQVSAHATTVSQALKDVEAVPCDFAIVDLFLKGEMASPVLDKLRDRGIPFLVASGAYVADIPPRHLGAPRLSKPYDLHALQHAIDGLALGASTQRSA